MQILNGTSFGEGKDIVYDQKHFESLYIKPSPKVYGFFIGQTYCEELAEELLIKVFLKVWEYITSFNDNDEKRIIKIVLQILNDVKITYKQNITYKTLNHA